MAHIHEVIDDDRHFLIDIASRNVTHPTEILPVVIQHDHNSERFTFDIPKTIDGHDLTDCNLVQVHFINTDKDNVENFNASISEVKDLQVMEDDPTKVVFSWLIPQAATHLAGPLTFAIQFACTTSVEDTDENGDPIVKSVLEYAWNTHPFIGIIVSDGMNNEEVLSDQYYSAVDAWADTIKYYGTEARNTAVTEIRQKQAEAVTAVTNTAAKSKSDAISGIDQHAREVKQNLTEDALDIADVMVPLNHKYYYVSYVEYNDKDPSKSKMEANYDEGEFAPDDDILNNSKLFGYTIEGYPVYDWSGIDNNGDLDYKYCDTFTYNASYDSKIPNLKVVKDIVDKKAVDTYNQTMSSMENVSDHINDLESDVNERISYVENDILKVLHSVNGFKYKCELGDVINPYDNEESIYTYGSDVNLHEQLLSMARHQAYCISGKDKVAIKHESGKSLKGLTLFALIRCFDINGGYVLVELYESVTDISSGDYTTFGDVLDNAGNDYQNLTTFEIGPIIAKYVSVSSSDKYIQFTINWHDGNTWNTTNMVAEIPTFSGVDRMIIDESGASNLYLFANPYLVPGVEVYSYNGVYDPDESIDVTVHPNGITNISEPVISGLDKTYTIHLSNGTTKTFTVKDGKDGEDGVGINSIICDYEGDYESTFSVELTDGNDALTFKIPNGNSAGVKTELSGPIIRADNVIPINHKVKTSLRSKNLINLDNVTIIGNGTLTVNDDNITIQADSDNEIYGFRITNENLGRLEIGKTYTASISNVTAHGTNWGWRLYYTDKTYESSEGSKNVVYTFTPKKEVSVLQFYVGFPYKESETVNVYGIQLEEGDTATPCTSYVDLSTVTLTRCGKNLIPYPHSYGSGDIFGVTYTRNDDGTVVATGTTNNSSIYYVVSQSHGMIHLIPGTYTLSGCPSGGEHSTYRLTIKSPANANAEGKEVYFHEYGEGITFTITEDMWAELYIFIGTGTTVNAMDFKPQLEIGSEATPYEPYTATAHKSTSDGILVTTPRSVAPTMTLLTDKPGVIIDTVYNRDQSVIANEILDISNEFLVDMERHATAAEELLDQFLNAMETPEPGTIVKRGDNSNIELPDQLKEEYEPGDDEAVSRAFVEKHAIVRSAPITMYKWIEGTPYTYSTKVDYDGIHVTEDEDGGVYGHTCYKAHCIEYKDRDGNTISKVSLPENDGDDYDIELATLKDIKALNETYSRLIEDQGDTIGYLQSEITNLWDRIIALETNLAKGDQTS